MPDDGIEKFTTLALQKNENIRITVQENWLWQDTAEPVDKLSTQKTFDYNAITGAELREIHAPVFKSIDDHIAVIQHPLSGVSVMF